MRVELSDFFRTLKVMRKSAGAQGRRLQGDRRGGKEHWSDREKNIPFI